MVRDFLKDKKYFDKYIEYENSSISKFENALKKVIQERGKEDKGVKSTYNYLFGLYTGKLKALYSLGVPLKEIKDFYSEVVDIMEKAWKIESGYVEMLWMLSIGNMLEIDNTQFSRLVKLIKTQNVTDFLYDYLIQVKQPKNQKQPTENLLFETPYIALKQIIKSENKDYQCMTLKKYLEKDWYDGHDDMGWYDSHNSQHDIYSGYWSFESGAIAKILKLDDSDLKNTPYYPYDMVHYRDN